jgi:hypothetical protein
MAGQIKYTLIHDITGLMKGDKFFAPRVEGYAKFNKMGVA